MENTITILALDTAIRNTGWCVAKIDIPKESVSFKAAGVIKTDSSLSDDAAVRLLITEFQKLLNKYKPDGTVSEEPVVLHKTSSKFLYARAKSFSQTKAAVYGILGYCFYVNEYFRTVFPSTWQGFFKIGKNKQMSVKDHSLKTANKFLRNSNSSIGEIKSDHIADAVNIAMFSAVRIISKAWIVK